MKEQEPHKRSEHQASLLMIQPAFVTASEAAKICGRSPRQMRYLAVNEDIYAAKIGRDWLFSRDEVQRYAGFLEARREMRSKKS